MLYVIVHISHVDLIHVSGIGAYNNQIVIIANHVYFSTRVLSHNYQDTEFIDVPISLTNNV